jgi:hypothetical protein
MVKENSCSQIVIITRITAFACLTGMALSFRLWLSDRHFPLVPVFKFLPEIGYLPIIAGLMLVCIIIFRRSQKFIIVFLIIDLLLAIMDQNRWQPWYYQYTLMFFSLSFFNFRCDDVKQQTAIITTFKIMVASLYFFYQIPTLGSWNHFPIIWEIIL